MSGLGVPHEGIAVLLDIDAKTLRKHFHTELERGSVEATAKVAQSVFQMATNGKNVAAALFWMKARAGWREKHEMRVTSGNDLSQYTDEELHQMIQKLERDRLVYADRSAAPALIEGSAKDDG